MAEASTTSADTTTAARARNSGKSAHPPQDVQWWLIIKTNGKLTLHLLNLSSSQTGTTVMNILHKKYKSMKPAHDWYFSSPQIEEAVVSPFCTGDPEAQDYPREVIIESSTLRPDLTEAFHNSTVLRGARDFLRLNAQFNILPGEAQSKPRRAILIKTNVCQFILVGVSAVVVLFAIVAGIVVGVLVHSAILGVATSTGVIGIFALVQGYLFGMKLLG